MKDEKRLLHRSRSDKEIVYSSDTAASSQLETEGAGKQKITVNKGFFCG
jgi:hypothetical protein